MLRYEPAVGILRFYPENTDIDDLSAPYDASCTILWESPGVVWLKGLSGKFTRKHLEALIRYGLENNIRLLKTYRNSGNLPFMTSAEGRYCEVDLEKNRDRLLKFVNRPPSL